MITVKNTKKSNVIIIALVILILIASVCASSIRVSGADNTTGLYINDKYWYNESKYPLQIIDGVIYVPITAFNELGNIVTYVAPRLDVLYIENTESEQYFSIDRDNNLAIDNNTTIYETNTYIYRDIIYVQLKQAAGLVGLYTSEYKNNRTGRTYYRIHNGAEKLSFKELLAIYNSSALNPEDISTEPATSADTESVESSSPATKPTTSDSDITVKDPVNIYITFQGIGSNTDEILDLLNDHDIKASFFVTRNDIVADPSLILRIWTSGHTLALTDDGKTKFENKEQFIEYLSETNILLSRLIKSKSHIARSYGGCDGGLLKIDQADANAISLSGYILWDYNLDSRDDILSAADSIRYIQNSIDETETPVLLMRGSAVTYSVLDRLIDYIETTRLYIPLPISVYDTEINNSQSQT